MTESATRTRPWGVGFSYRFPVHAEILSAAGAFDFLELPTCDYTDASRRRTADPDWERIEQIARRFPLIAHSTSLSMGSAGAPDGEELRRLERFLERVPVSEVSEHLSFTLGSTRAVDSFVPLPFTDLGVAAAAANARTIADRSGLPFFLENVTYLFAIPGAQLSEAEFITRVVERADCGILLDVANLFINATNHHYEWRELVDGLPAERVAQSHFCGATDDRGFLLDTHCERTPEEVWQVLDYALSKTSLRALILERDDRFQPFTEVLDEVWRAKELFARHRAASPPAEFERTVRRRPASREREADLVLVELARFQDALLELLSDRELALAVDREGESALRHTGLAREERRWLAAIPSDQRDRFAAGERNRQAGERARRAAQRRRDFARWSQIPMESAAP